MGLGDYEVAARMREVIKAAASQVVAHMRPEPVYGELVEIEYMTGDEPNPLQPVAWVRLPGDAPDALAPYKVANVPMRLPGNGEGSDPGGGTVGAYVRVEGPNGDRYIIPTILPDVLEGPSRISVCEREPEVKRINDLWCPTGQSYPGA